MFFLFPDSSTWHVPEQRMQRMNVGVHAENKASTEMLPKLPILPIMVNPPSSKASCIALERQCSAPKADNLSVISDIGGSPNPLVEWKALIGFMPTMPSLCLQEGKSLFLLARFLEGRCQKVNPSLLHSVWVRR